MKNKFYMIILVLFLNLLGLTSCGGPIGETYSYNSAVVFSSSDIVNGKVENKKGIIKSYLMETKTHLTYSVNDKNGKLAITEYEKILERLLDILVMAGVTDSVSDFLDDALKKIYPTLFKETLVLVGNQIIKADTAADKDLFNTGDFA